jgi:hypothetical protein
MSRFIKLTGLIINTNIISHITHSNSIYTIVLQTPKISGSTILGSGSFSTGQDEIRVTDAPDCSDYQNVKKWIDSLE